MTAKTFGLNFILHVCFSLLFAFALTAGVVRAQTVVAYTDLHDFGGTVTNANGSPGPDGENPCASVAFDSAGNMYGTADEGGANGWSSGPGFGTAWEITASGTYYDLHDFGGTVTNAGGTSGPDGSAPFAGVTFDGAGNMYGTAKAGGANGTGFFFGGVLWKITASGTYQDLHDFGGTITNASGTSSPDGEYPVAGITFDSAGNMCGTTVYGRANNCGMVREMTASGTYRDLHDFGGTVTNANGTAGPDGEYPSGATFDSAGNIYGTTGRGGPNGSGMVREVTASGAYRDLHDFGGTVTNANGSTGPDGGYCGAGVTFDGAGNMCGTAEDLGPHAAGMVWEITASGTYKDLHDFGATVTNASGSPGPDGMGPMAGVTFDSAGNINGTTCEGGPVQRLWYGLGDHGVRDLPGPARLRRLGDQRQRQRQPGRHISLCGRHVRQRRKCVRNDTPGRPGCRWHCLEIDNRQRDGDIRGRCQAIAYRDGGMGQQRCRYRDHCGFNRRFCGIPRP